MQAKMAVIGKSGVGKSQLLSSVVATDYQKLDSITISGVYSQHSAERYELTVQKITEPALDSCLAGDFYSSATVVALVYDPADLSSFAYLEEHMEAISKAAGARKKFFLIGNCKNDQPSVVPEDRVKVFRTKHEIAAAALSEDLQWKDAALNIFKNAMSLAFSNNNQPILGFNGFNIDQVIINSKEEKSIPVASPSLLAINVWRFMRNPAVIGLGAVFFVAGVSALVVSTGGFAAAAGAAVVFGLMLGGSISAGVSTISLGLSIYSLWTKPKGGVPGDALQHQDSFSELQSDQPESSVV